MDKFFPGHFETVLIFFVCAILYLPYVNGLLTRFNNIIIYGRKEVKEMTRKRHILSQYVSTRDRDERLPEENVSGKCTDEKEGGEIRRYEGIAGNIAGCGNKRKIQLLAQTLRYNLNKK